MGWLIIMSLAAAAAGGGLVAALFLTSPQSLGPAGVTAWFVVCFGVLACAGALGLYALKWYLRLHGTNVARLRYSWRQGMLISAWVVGLLALGSLRQLSLLDGILLGILLVIVEVYVRFRWP